MMLTRPTSTGVYLLAMPKGISSGDEGNASPNIQSLCRIAVLRRCGLMLQTE